MRTLALATIAAAAVAWNASAQQYVYPAKGQSPDQQKQDEAACGTWATQQSGFNPSAPPPAPPQGQAPVTGSGARARGAAAGAIVGAATGNDTGDAAKAGAVAGGVAQRGSNRRAARDQQAAASQQQSAGQDAYLKARGACLEGKGYTVK
ncbi:MAG TPA: hypothetical protein VMG61_04345 [Usitatibacter sp.]|nr:hypothetical protein [Usitatibacter sp.]